MFSTQKLRVLAVVGAAAMSLVGVGAAIMPLKAQNQELLCMYEFPGCGYDQCQQICTWNYPGSTGHCQGPNGECCNCYY